MPALFAFTLFVSASLLFMIQPMVGKLVLPLLGGGAGVWNTCMVFFQALLLLGYLYAHKVGGLANVRSQVGIHIVMLTATLGVMLLAVIATDERTPIPVLRSLAPQGSSFPFVNVLAMLAIAIGLPFFALSTSAPLLQRWFAFTGHASAKDPYFLYAASNVGSLLSLLAYPLATEPSLRVFEQTWLFGILFVLLLALSVLCGMAVRNPVRPSLPSIPLEKNRPVPELVHSLPLGRRLRWLGLAFVPSSLMLGVTTHMTTDIASVPFLWVIPLALYLLTFIIAFATTPTWFRPVMANVSPVGTLILVFVITSRVPISTFGLLGIHLGAYFLAALLMHSELARDRPPAKHLTAFYLWMSVGGMLGGLFNAIIAPLALPYTYEYPIAIAIGCLLIPSLSDAAQTAEAPPSKPSPDREAMRLMLDFAIPMLMVVLVALISMDGARSLLVDVSVWLADSIQRVLAGLNAAFTLEPKMVRLFLTYAPPCMACFLFIDRPQRFGLCVAAVLFVHYYQSEAHDPRSRLTSRSFYGILKVTEYPEQEADRVYFRKIEEVRNESGEIEKANVEQAGYEILYRVNVLAHGTTTHGSQFVDKFRISPYVRKDSPKPEVIVTGCPPTLGDHLRLVGTATNPIALASGWGAITLAGAREAWDPTQDPLTYYHRTGPIGDLFTESFQRTRKNLNRLPNVGMVGLGTGSVACYAADGMNLTFYEIDPTVIDMVEKPRVMNPDKVKAGEAPEYGPFTYIADGRKRGAKIDFVLGDARLKLEQEKDRRYDLLLVDAFSSDSIPIHLLTVESVRLYTERLSEHGLIAMHISNRYIRLEPVVAAIAKELKLTCRVFGDTADEAANLGKTSSTWVVLTRTPEDLGQALGETPRLPIGAFAGGVSLVNRPERWEPMETIEGVRPWTDDYADVPAVIRSKEFQWFRRKFGLSTPVTE